MKFAALRQFALSLPEVAEAPHHHFGSFRVRGKIFVTVPPEQDRLHLFVGETEREQALALYPQCVQKLHWGGKVAGLCLMLGAADAKIAKALVRQAWAHKAPPSLRAAMSA